MKLLKSLDPGDIAIIYSSFIDVSNLNSPELNFYYHMFGPNMGTLEIEVFDGNSFTNIFTLTGDQGDQWFFKIVSPLLLVLISFNLKLLVKLVGTGQEI